MLLRECGWAFGEARPIDIVNYNKYHQVTEYDAHPNGVGVFMAIRLPWLIIFLVGMAVFGIAVFALPTASTQSGGGGDNSVWVRVDGGPKHTGLSDGDVVGRVDRDAGRCAKLTITVGFRGDTKSARVGIDPETCDVVVREIVPNPKYAEFTDPES